VEKCAPVLSALISQMLCNFAYRASMMFMFITYRLKPYQQ